MPSESDDAAPSTDTPSPFTVGVNAATGFALAGGCGVAVGSVMVMSSKAKVTGTLAAALGT